MTQKEQEQLKVVNLIMLLQQVIYACDEVSEIKWFNAHRTKQSLRSLERIILADHNHVMTAFWKTEGVNMADVSKVLDEFKEAIGKVHYHKLPIVTEWLLNNEELREV